MRTLSYSMSLNDLLVERVFTEAQLRAHSLTVSFAKAFADLHNDWLAVQNLEIKHLIEVATADALAVGLDGQLNVLLDLVNLALLAAVGNDRDADLYKHFFGNQRPSDAKRPVLGEQLAMQRDWIPVLKSSKFPGLQALAAPLEKLVKQAEGAASDLRDKKEAEAAFVDIGERKKFVDDFNAARRTAHGKLSALPKLHPESNLPSDFAEQFFIRESRSTMPTQGQVLRNIQRLQDKLQKEQALYAELAAQKAAQDKARSDAEAAHLRAELQDAEKQAAAEQARIAELKAKLGQLGK